MIAVTFALPSESSDFRQLLRQRQQEIAILHTGVGREISQRRLQQFLDHRSCDYLISSGFAGGIAPSLGVGDLFLAENFSDPALLATARDLLIAQVGTLASAAKILESGTERAHFARAQAAAAVDMETAWIAEICAARKIPLLSLRVISDTAAAPFPAPAGVLFDLQRQSTPALKLAGYLLRNPAALGKLLRFSRQISRARGNLAGALDEVIRTVGPAAVA